jgi:hypothetical protein
VSLYCFASRKRNCRKYFNNTVLLQKVYGKIAKKIYARKLTKLNPDQYRNLPEAQHFSEDRESETKAPKMCTI